MKLFVVNYGEVFLKSIVTAIIVELIIEFASHFNLTEHCKFGYG